MKRVSIILLAFLFVLPLIAGSANAQVPFQPDSAMSYIETLANPERFHGRKSGMEGGNRSQAWIAEQFRAWGLTPLIGDDVLLPYAQLVTREEKGELTLENDPRYGDIDFLLGDDYTLCTNSGSGKVRAPVVLVGHGISKPEKEWDDYGDVPLEGKIAVIFRGSPNDAYEWHAETSRSYLYPEAIRHGAVAVLFYQGDPVNGASIPEDAYNPDVPVGYIGERVLSHLLFGSGYTLDTYRAELRKGPFPLQLRREMTFRAEVDRLPDGTAYNVAGIVPGTDPELAKEAVILGGHGDHVGRNSLGHVYPGADDNASGASVVMELARNYAKHPQPRTLVFCVFGGEEQGLLGSRALAAQLPEEYTYVNMVNVDMAGRGEGVTGMGGGDQLPDVWDPWYETLPDSVKRTIMGGRAWGGWSSDHAPFRNAGIPAFTSYSRGSHDYYHSADDRFYTIHRPAVAGVLDAASRWLEAIASHSEPLAVRQLEERTIWHTGRAFTWMSAEVDEDTLLTDAKRRVQAGLLGVVLEFDAPATEEQCTAFPTRLATVREKLSEHPRLAYATSLGEIGRNAYRARGSVFLALRGDGLGTGDTTHIPFWKRDGISWVRLADPEVWLSDGKIRQERRALLRSFASEGLQIQLPMAHAEAFAPLIEEYGTSTLLVGAWPNFKLLDEEVIGRYHELGTRFLVMSSDDQLPSVAKSVDRIARYRVHVQPDANVYELLLHWVAVARAEELDREQIGDLIGGHISLW